ncbi:MAG TPA: molybdopterin cofactor-binding domain-containing protein [Croceibacterium sp.]|nr:molybdopterin cofactor-binding domain-containing protein [Croceibacterium sp.]
MHVTRRGLLIGAAAGGGLLLAWGFQPRRFSNPLVPGEDEAAFGAWIKIAKDGVVTVAVPQLEMGQGVTTLLPQIVAIELGADWRQVAVQPAPVSGAYANLPLAARWSPLWQPTIAALANEPNDWLLRRWAEGERFTATADGTSIAAYEQPCREAAASARAMLAQSAAARWNVDWEECQATAGFILHGNKRATFGDLAEDAAGYDPPDPPPLRSAPAAEQPGRMADGDVFAFPRLDLPAKVDGSLLFAGDVRLPDMLFAAIRQGPQGVAELSGFDKNAAKGIRGLRQVIDGKRWLAAVADTWWIAEHALEAMQPRFSVKGAPDSGTIEEQLDKAIRSEPGETIWERGEGKDAVGKPDLALRYDFAPAVHGSIETASATARLADDKLELWVATQAPEAVRKAAARALGMSERDVVLYPVPAGGSFDRRLEHDHAIQAALLAREIGRPIALTWSRQQEQLALRPRTPAAALLTVKLGPQGNILAWRSRWAMPASAREFGRRLFDGRTSWAAIEDVEGEADPLALEGAMPPYAIPNVEIAHIPVRIALATGRLRGNAHGLTAFASECFFDEIAHRHDREPLSYRIEHLGHDLRLAQCLQRAARLAEWGGGGEASGQGLACHRMGDLMSGGCIAVVATATRGEGGVRVEKLSAAVDIGRIVNLDIARQQIEGGLIFGLGIALGAATDYEGGIATARRLADLTLPKLGDSPEIVIDFVASDAPPFDPGELGTAVVAPAVANALFSAAGIRLRRLPLLSANL